MSPRLFPPVRSRNPAALGTPPLARPPSVCPTLLGLQRQAAVQGAVCLVTKEMGQTC